jgi:FKBP-type peptidyl-prolyl cis-trans isomerase FklB
VLNYQIVTVNAFAVEVSTALALVKIIGVNIHMRTVLAIALCIVLTSCTNNAQDNVELKSSKDSVSYAIGVQIGTSFRTQEIDIDRDILMAALNHSMNDTNQVLNEEQVMAVMNSFQMEMAAKQQEKQMKAGAENKEIGVAFLAENAKKEGVKVTASGLQYKVITEGTGAIPTKEDKVVCHYTGKLIDGKKFDSSLDRGEPATFPVTGVIAGWTEALQIMPVGSKWILYIPSELGYGERGAGGDIGPNATLIFELELLSIEGK